MKIVFRLEIVILMIVLISVASCKKQTYDPLEDVQNVDHGGYSPYKTIEIELFSPTSQDTIDYGENIFIQGKVIGNFDLHGYSLRLYNVDNGDELVWVKNEHVHGEVLDFEGAWTNSLTEDTHIELEVFAVGNHESTLDMTKRIPIFCKGE